MKPAKQPTSNPNLRWKSRQRSPPLPNVKFIPAPVSDLTPEDQHEPAPHSSQPSIPSQCQCSLTTGLLAAGDSVGVSPSTTHPTSSSAQILPLPPAPPQLGSSRHSQPSSQEPVLLLHKTPARLSRGERQQQETPECWYQPWSRLPLAANTLIRQSTGQSGIPVSNGHNYIS